MLIDKAISHFKSRRALAEALGVTVQAVSQWGRTVPELRARQLHEITQGKLSFDRSAYVKPGN